MITSNIPVDIITNDCFAARVRLLNRQVTKIYDDVLRPLGIKAAQMNILIVLAKLGPSSTVRIREVLAMEKSTLTRNVQRLCARGLLVALREGPGQTHRLEVTAGGYQLMDRVLPRWEEAQRQTVSTLNSHTIELLRQLPTAMWPKEHC